MSRLDKVDLHDALIRGSVFDYPKKTVTVNLAIYREPQARSRAVATIRFSGVSQISHVADFEHIAENAFAGTVNSWAPQEQGTTFIYLVNGVLAITAKRIAVKVER